MPGSFRFEPCPTCCVTGCVYESDDFNRADSTSLGAKWTETTGDWSIDTNRLKIVATADAKCTCTTTHPTASTKYIVSVSITLGTDGDVARAWVDDSAFFAELERITSTCGRLRLYDGTTCKGSVNVALGGYTRIVLCSEGDKVHVGTGGAPMLTVSATVASSIVAVGTGGACTGTVYFEDFSLSKHSEDDATCPACGDEGCTWFQDIGCTSAALSAVDYSATGTWEMYGPGGIGAIRCTADGTLTILPPNPLATNKCVFRLHRLANPMFSWPVGATVTVNLGGSASYVIDYGTTITGAYGPFRGRVMKGGVQYGVTVDTFGDVDTFLDWDGSILRVCRVGLFSPNFIGAVADTIASLTPTITVSGIGSTWVAWKELGLTKHPDDIGGCTECGQPNCTACAAGTFANHATVTIANITSNAYGCTCTDTTIDLYATATGCQWSGTTTGPCSSGTWTATAAITAVTGGYKLTVTLTTTSGAGATFENTVLSATPVDCLTAFDGSVPWVSSSGTGTPPCGLGSATCTFATP